MDTLRADVEIVLPDKKREEDRPMSIGPDLKKVLKDLRSYSLLDYLRGIVTFGLILSVFLLVFLVMHL